MLVFSCSQFSDTHLEFFKQCSMFKVLKFVYYFFNYHQFLGDYSFGLHFVCMGSNIDSLPKINLRKKVEKNMSKNFTFWKAIFEVWTPSYGKVSFVHTFCVLIFIFVFFSVLDIALDAAGFLFLLCIRHLVVCQSVYSSTEKVAQLTYWSSPERLFSTTYFQKGNLWSVYI